VTIFHIEIECKRLILDDDIERMIRDEFDAMGVEGQVWVEEETIRRETIYHVEIEGEFIFTAEDIERLVRSEFLIMGVDGEVWVEEEEVRRETFLDSTAGFYLLDPRP
jgi:hypothetical protein